MGKMSRDKGKRGEREFAMLLRDHGYEGRRGVQYHGGPDSPDVTGLPGFHIEVKRVERLNLYDAMEQSEQDADAHETPIVAHRKNGKKWLVVMRADDFFGLLDGEV